LWNNFVGSTDVDNDGVTTARDALLIINDLASLGGRDLPSAPPAFTTPFFIDVSNDFRVTPQDVLQVINEINALVGRNNGAPIPPSLLQTISPDIREISDDEPDETVADVQLEHDEATRLWTTDRLMAAVRPSVADELVDARAFDPDISFPAALETLELDVALDAEETWYALAPGSG
jgi:hypothetical protein